MYSFCTAIQNALLHTFATLKDAMLNWLIQTGISVVAKSGLKSLVLYLFLQLEFVGSLRILEHSPDTPADTSQLTACLCSSCTQQKLLLPDNDRDCSNVQGLTLAMGMSLLLLLVLSSPVLGLMGRLAGVRRPGLDGPVAWTLCKRVCSSRTCKKTQKSSACLCKNTSGRSPNLLSNVANYSEFLIFGDILKGLL